MLSTQFMCEFPSQLSDDKRTGKSCLGNPGLQ